MSSQRTRESLVVPESAIRQTCGETPVPELGVIGQVWDTDPIPCDAIPDSAGEAFASLDLDGVPEGGEIALGVGSRGIANLADIVAGAVTEVREQGYEPFVFPAMGSHGGATAERDVPVYTDENAAAADAPRRGTLRRSIRRGS
jgi:hypothetical protein